MKITISSPSNQEAVDAINKKLGTKFSVFDYHAWESGRQNEGTEEFSKAVEQFVGSTSYKTVSKLAFIRGYLSAKFGKHK